MRSGILWMTVAGKGITGMMTCSGRWKFSTHLLDDVAMFVAIKRSIMAKTDDQRQASQHYPECLTTGGLHDRHLHVLQISLWPQILDDNRHNTDPPQ